MSAPDVAASCRIPPSDAEIDEVVSINPPLRDRDQREKDRAKLNADPVYAEKKAKLTAKGFDTERVENATLDEIAATRLRKAQIHASVMAVMAARKAKKEKIPTLEVEEEQKQPKSKKGIALPMRPDLGAMAEAEVERVNPAESVPVRTKRDKKLSYKQKQKLTLKLLDEQRKLQLQVQRDGYRADMEGRWKEAHPEATDAECQAAVKQEDVEKFYTWEQACRDVTLASFKDQSTMTDAQRNEARKLQEKQDAAERAMYTERMREREAAMAPVDRLNAQRVRERLERLWEEWKTMGLKDHERRQELRVDMHLQLLMQVSIWLHSIVVDAFDNGIPQSNPKTRQPFWVPADASKKDQVTIDEKQAALDDQGKPIRARLPRGQRLYMEINIEPESVIQGCADWSPESSMRIVGIEELQVKLTAQSESVAKELHPQKKALLVDGETMMTELMRKVKGYSDTEVVLLIQMKCDSMRPLTRPSDAPFKATMRRAIAVIERDIQDNQAYIDSQGPFKGKTMRCHRDGAFILIGTPINYGGKVIHMSERDKLSIKSCDRPECAKAGFLAAKPMFCCKACKQKHVDEVHESTGLARRRAYNKVRKANKRAARLAEKAEDAKREAAGRDEAKDEADIAAAVAGEEEEERKSDESEADEEIEA